MSFPECYGVSNAEKGDLKRHEQQSLPASQNYKSILLLDFPGQKAAWLC